MRHPTPIRQRSRIGRGESVPVGWPTGEDETPVAIAAFNRAAFINLEPDAGMAQGSASGDVRGSVTRDAAAFDGDGLWLVVHAARLARPAIGCNPHGAVWASDIQR
jgi:hypothetical protein